MVLYIYIWLFSSFSIRLVFANEPDVNKGWCPSWEFRQVCIRFAVINYLTFYGLVLYIFVIIEFNLSSHNQQRRPYGSALCCLPWTYRMHRHINYTMWRPNRFNRYTHSAKLNGFSNYFLPKTKTPTPVSCVCDCLSIGSVPHTVRA